MIKQALRSVLGILAGYAVMVVLLTLAQDVLFGGVSYHGSSVLVLLIAGILSFASAVAGGLVAVAAAGHAFRIHAMVMGALVVLETTALVSSGKLAGPLWFDILASASLIVGIFAGAEVFSYLRTRASSPDRKAEAI